MVEQRASRRDLMAGAALAAAMADPTAETASPQLWSAEYWANKGDTRLCPCRKRRGVPRSSPRTRPKRINHLLNGDRQFVMLDNAAHALALGLNRARARHAVHAFLSMPAPVHAS